MEETKEIQEQKPTLKDRAKAYLSADMHLPAPSKLSMSREMRQDSGI